MTSIILIPARLNSTRLPRKPLALIAGLPMIVHVLKQAEAARIGPAFVACDSPEIVECIQKARAKNIVQGQALLTDPDLPSGTDRIACALQKADPKGEYQYIINLQGDMPLIAPQLICDLIAYTQTHPADITTAAHLDRQPASADRVKVVFTNSETDPKRALYFSRASIPHNSARFWHHIGIYAFTRAALLQFCTLPACALEQTERLEQLRALNAGMRINILTTSHVVQAVDTPDDLRHIQITANQEKKHG